MRMFYTAKELGEPLKFSDDDVLDFKIKEALVARAAKEAEKAEKAAERERWKNDPEFRKG